jgi:hypothetical protein
MPLETWPERRWRGVERLLGVRPSDTRAFREAIRQALALYVVLARDDTHHVPETAVEGRAEAKELATAARYLAERGLQLGFPDATRSALPTALLFILLPEVLAGATEDRTSPLLEPHELALLAERAQAYAARYRHRPGPPSDVALVQFVHGLMTIVERYGGPGVKASLSWREDRSGQRTGRAGNYSAVLFELARRLQPAMPRAARSIAECKPSTLGARLSRARQERNRLWPGLAGAR